MTGGAGADRRLRLGVIGAGGLASARIYPCFPQLPLELVAVCDLDPVRAARAARAYGAASVFHDHREMLRCADLDAVIVSVGPGAHPQLAIDVMEAGLPVYTEKPPSITSADALAMLDASRRTGNACMTAFQKRFAPVYRKARAAVETGAVGAPCLLTMVWCCQGDVYRDDPEDPLTWFLLDFGIHMIDLARYLLGEVEEAYARKLDEAAYAVTLTFSSGAVGSLSLAPNRRGVLTEKVELFGDDGHISIPDVGRMVRYRGTGVVDWHETPAAIADSLVEAGYRGELEEFVASSLAAREPESSIASAYETMRLYEAIDRSAKQRCAVRLDAD